MGGWGSLIWKPGDLPIKGNWKEDGPLLPIEFARQSNDGRITLVLVPKYPLLNCCWIELDCNDFQEAQEALCKREGILRQ